jgi:Fe-S-cluster containining protein
VFLEGGKCSIYEVRPTQCRTYPFWPAIVRAPQTWAKEGEQCPGIGKGEVVDANEIDRQRELDIAERRRMGVE